jgi:pyruvate,water dikinase
MARFGRNRPKAVVPLADAVASSGRRDTQSGSLARALAGVERLGVTTPESYVVIADVFRHIVHTSLPPGHDPASLLRTAQRPVGIERAARARERLLAVPLEDEVERELDAAFRALSENAPWGIAVRASAVLTDQGFSRAAGLASTELPVFERAALGAAVRRAWARAASETTLQYLRGRKLRDVALAVVLQPVVPTLASLTLVTDSSTVTEPGSAEAGLGPSVRRLAVALAGLSTEDAELVDAEVSVFDSDGVVHSTRPLSQRAALVVKDHALAREPFREAGVQAPLLPRSRILELSEIARRLDPLGAHILRCAVPERGDVVVVDARPAHHFGYPTSGTAATLWSRAAVTDAPAEPLTLLSRQLMARPLLERARLSLGRNAPKASRPSKLQGLLSTIDGRPYVNLSRVLDADGEADAPDAISRIELADAQWTLGLVREPTFRISLARAGLRVAQLATEQRALADEVGRFERDADQQRRWLA